MKKLLITAIAAFSISAQAQPITEGVISACKHLSIQAREIMVSRQNGGIMADELQAAGENKQLQSLVLQSYDIPNFITEKHKNIAINGFENATFKGCIDFFKGR